MKIKTWLQIIVFLSTVIALSIGLFHFFYTRQINSAVDKSRLASKIIKTINDRRGIADDYLLYQKNEMAVQWQAMYDVVTNVLQSNEFKTEEEQSILKDMRDANEISKQIFLQLIDLQESELSGKISNLEFQESKTKLASRLLAERLPLLSGAYRLDEISYRDRETILQRANVFMMLSIGTLVALIFFILLLFGLKAVARLSSLHEGIRIITSGNLGYRVSHQGNDEIGQITRSFNEMSDTLQSAQIKIEEQNQKMVVKMGELQTNRRVMLSLLEDFNDSQKLLQKKAEELSRSNQELEQFAYIASHDLQEPLRQISNFVQLLEKRYKGQLDEKADQFIAYVVEGAARMRSMIMDLLAYSRVGKKTVLPQPINLSSLLDEVLKNLNVTIKESGAVVTVDPLPSITAIPSQINQLFQNLVGNALKFNKAGETPTVHVSAEKKGSEWIFSVRDNGIGIDPKYAEKIFVLFERLHGRGEYPGTGIGLAICKKIVELHNGRIWIQSVLGQGSTFYFTLPG